MTLRGTPLTMIVIACIASVYLAAFASPSDIVLLSQDRILSVPKGIGRQTPQTLAMSVADRWAPFNLHVRTDRQDYRIGDLMHISISADHDCYILVYYIDASGEAAVICPSPFSTNNHLRAGVPFALVDNEGKLLQQKGPLGTEHLQVLASTQQFDMNSAAGLGEGPPDGLVTNHPTPSHTPSPTPRHTPATHQSYTVHAQVMAQASVRVGRPHRVIDPDGFSKGMETVVRHRVEANARLVATRYKGIGPRTHFDSRYRCFGLDSLQYQVVPR